MKQIVLIGDLAAWQQYAGFVTDIVHYTANRILTINLGPEAVADINCRKLRQLFPHDQPDTAAAKTMARLYSQGLADGVMVLGACKLRQQLLAALEAVPYGTPKVLVLQGQCQWQPRSDVVLVRLPGEAGNLNPVVKIALSNAVFALAGMTMNNILNYGSPNPLVAVVARDDVAARWLNDSKLNFLLFHCQAPLLCYLARQGYIHGLLVCGDACAGNLSPWVQLARQRSIPLVATASDPMQMNLGRDGTSFPGLVVVTNSQAGPAGVDLRHVGPSYGSPGFYRQAARILLQMLHQT